MRLSAAKDPPSTGPRAQPPGAGAVSAGGLARVTSPGPGGIWGEARAADDFDGLSRPRWPRSWPLEGGQGGGALSNARRTSYVRAILQDI